jgi:hypothetical protein
MFWSWLHWQDIPVLNVLVMVTRYSWNTAKAGDKHQSINMECFGHGYIDRVFQYWMFWPWLHWQSIPVLIVFGHGYIDGIPVLNVFGHGYIDRIFQYWMFLVLVTLTGYSSIECLLEYSVNVTMAKTFNSGIPCQCNHDQNIPYWLIDVYHQP